jgi:hypothetical protein
MRIKVQTRNRCNHSSIGVITKKNPKILPILKILVGFVLRRPNQTNPRKEKQDRNNTHHGKCGYSARMINNFNAGINKADNSKHGKYGPKGSF